jgi:hypothetical protein
VFLDMVLVLKCRKVHDMCSFLHQHGSGCSSVRMNLAGAGVLIAEPEAIDHVTDNAVLRWVRDMVRVRRQLRPIAASLIGSTLGARAGKEWSGYRAFCGICCASPDNDHNDMWSNFDNQSLTRTTYVAQLQT